MTGLRGSFPAVASFYQARKVSRLTVNEVLANELQGWYNETVDNDPG